LKEAEAEEAAMVDEAAKEEVALEEAVSGATLAQGIQQSAPLSDRNKEPTQACSAIGVGRAPGQPPPGSQPLIGLGTCKQPAAAMG
jgi:hypothetical protein